MRIFGGELSNPGLLVVGRLGKKGDDDQHGFCIDNDLGVVALLKAATRHFHDVYYACEGLSVGISYIIFSGPSRNYKNVI